MGKREAGGAVALLAAAFPSFRFDDSVRAEVWILNLEDLPGDALAAAVRSLICTAKFPPTIAEIRGAVLAVRDPALGTTGEEAWPVLIDEIMRVGNYGKPQFEDPLIARAAQCLGTWRDLCMSDTGPTMAAHRARFVNLYDDLKRKARHELLLPDVLRKQIAAAQRDHLPAAYAAGELADGVERSPTEGGEP